jgi:hypothetical protein
VIYPTLIFEILTVTEEFSNLTFGDMGVSLAVLLILTKFDRILIPPPISVKSQNLQIILAQYGELCIWLVALAGPL